jgi:hypothetical protein
MAGRRRVRSLSSAVRIFVMENMPVSIGSPAHLTGISKLMNSSVLRIMKA